MATAFPSPDSQISSFEEFLNSESGGFSDVSATTRAYLNTSIKSGLDKLQKEKKETEGEKRQVMPETEDENGKKVVPDTEGEEDDTSISETDSDTTSYIYLKKPVLTKASIKKASTEANKPLPEEPEAMPEELTGIDWKLPFEETQRFMNNLLESVPVEKLKPKFEKFLESERMKKAEESLSEFAQTIQRFVRVTTGKTVFKKWLNMGEEDKRRPSLEMVNEDDTDIESMPEED